MIEFFLSASFYTNIRAAVISIILFYTFLRLVSTGQKSQKTFITLVRIFYKLILERKIIYSLIISTPQAFWQKNSYEK